MPQRIKPLDAHVPMLLRAWLLASGSLTKQLTQLAQGQFYVKPLAQGFQPLARSTSAWLATPPNELAWVRESLLYGASEQPWVQAKSLFPMRSLTGAGLRFRYLGSRPVGHLLFERTRPQCKRRVLYLPEGWTRQSCYTWHGRVLMVQETFLPAFIDYLQQHPQQSPL